MRANAIGIAIDQAPANGLDGLAQRLPSAMPAHAEGGVGHVMPFGIVGRRFAAQIDPLNDVSLFRVQVAEKQPEAIAGNAFVRFSGDFEVVDRRFATQDSTFHGPMSV